MGSIDSFSLSIKPLPQSPRRIWVYLPDGYEESNAVYPVLYMFDGHNLFDDSLATYGKSWGMKEYLDSIHLPLVVVGQDCNHTGHKRIEEYCPVDVPAGTWFKNWKPQGTITADWFVRKLKPACEKKYRIHKEREYLGIGGSSMGGPMSAYMIAKYNDVYSKAACVSTTMDISTPQLIDVINNSTMSPDTRIYMDFGSRELKGKNAFAEEVDNMLMINHAFQEKSCNTFPNVVVGGYHSEATWETIVPLFLEYLYPDLYH